MVVIEVARVNYGGDKARKGARQSRIQGKYEGDGGGKTERAEQALVPFLSHCIIDGIRLF
jgi:hypothetical protein